MKISHIKRVREISTIQVPSPPIGILNNIEVNPMNCTLVAGDIIVMVSDGVAEAIVNTNDKENWLVNFLQRIPWEAPQGRLQLRYASRLKA